jgi:hypothetical protein
MNRLSMGRCRDQRLAHPLPNPGQVSLEVCHLPTKDDTLGLQPPPPSGELIDQLGLDG